VYLKFTLRKLQNAMQVALNHCENLHVQGWRV